MRSALTVISFLLCATAAQAHIVAKPDSGEAGAYFGTNLIVSHGCDGAATTSITVQIPQEILVIRPQMKAGWTIEIKKHKLDKPVAGPHGSVITEVTDSITWTGNLPDAYFDTFGLSMKLPDGVKDLYLPVNQVCDKGSRNWKDVPVKGQDPHALENPAPVIKVLPGSAHQHH